MNRVFDLMCLFYRRIKKRERTVDQKKVKGKLSQHLMLLNCVNKINKYLEDIDCHIDLSNWLSLPIRQLDKRLLILAIPLLPKAGLSSNSPLLAARDEFEFA